MRLSDWGSDRWKARILFNGTPLDTQSITPPAVWDADDTEGWVKIMPRDRHGKIDLLKFKEKDLLVWRGKVEIQVKPGYTAPEHVTRRRERRPITRAPSLFEEKG